MKPTFPSLIGFLLLVIFRLSPGAVEPFSNGPDLSPQVREIVNRGAELIYQEKFNEAQKLLKQLVSMYPDEPIGYFFMAVVTDARMSFYYNEKGEEDFYGYCEKTIKKAEARLAAKPQDPWMYFFIGGACGFKGVFEARYHRYISAFRNGWDGITALKKALDISPEFIEPLYGLGTYNYWRSKLTTVLWWMPGVSDRREEGITQLKKVVQKGVLAREASIINLGYILIEEKRQGEALQLLAPILQKYPKSRMVKWVYGKALIQNKQYAEAEKILNELLDEIDADPENNHRGAIRCMGYLATIYFQRGQWLKAIAMCRRTTFFKLDREGEELLSEELPQIRDMMEQCLRYYQPN
jgi:tetratricopeptide (TPR) repeat protein